MNIMRVLFVYVFLSLGIPLPSEAEDTLSTQINLETGSDSEDGSVYFIDADIDLDGPRLSIGYGGSDVHYNSSVLSTTAKEISFGSNPLNDTSTSIGYSEWGQEGEINIRTYRFDVVFNKGNWSLSIGTENRDIEFHTLLIARPIINLDSNGANLGISYYGERWYLGLNYSTKNYSRDVSIFANDPRLVFIFSPITMEHAFGFEDSRISADIYYSLNWGNIGIDHSRSISAVDDSVSISNAVAMSFDMDKNWSLNLRSGQSENSLYANKTTFYTIGFGYQF